MHPCTKSAKCKISINRRIQGISGPEPANVTDKDEAPKNTSKRLNSLTIGNNHTTNNLLGLFSTNDLRSSERKSNKSKRVLSETPVSWRTCSNHSQSSSHNDSMSSLRDFRSQSKDTGSLRSSSTYRTSSTYAEVSSIEATND